MTMMTTSELETTLIWFVSPNGLGLVFGLNVGDLDVSVICCYWFKENNSKAMPKMMFQLKNDAIQGDLNGIQCQEQCFKCYSQFKSGIFTCLELVFC